MKRSWTLLIALFSIAAVAQSPKSCCEVAGSGSNAKFVALADDADFRDQHQEPRATQLGAVKGQIVTYPAAGGEAQAYYLKSENNSNKWLLVFHEWWGLNDQVKGEAAKLQSDLGAVNVLCLDLYDGKMATTREAAGQLMQNASADRIMAMIQGAQEYIGSDAKVATIGWCFGGGWSLQAAIALGESTEGCVMYYGMPETDAERLAKLDSDVLGIFAGRDQWINAEVVAEFKANAAKADIGLEVHVYDADHAFANPTNTIYDEEATEAAYALTLDYLRQRLMNY